MGGWGEGWWGGLLYIGIFVLCWFVGEWGAGWFVSSVLCWFVGGWVTPVAGLVRWCLRFRKHAKTQHALVGHGIDVLRLL